MALFHGTTAAEIAGSIRKALDRGALAPGDALPTAKELSQELGVNRNTVTAAYRQLILAGLLSARRGAGTTVAMSPTRAEEGFLPDTVVADVGSGNPDRALLPDLSRLCLPPGQSVLYGESTIDPDLETWARDWFSEELERPFDITVMGGAVDAVERLLTMALSQGDGVGLEDPCFLTSVNTVRRLGYRPVPIPMDQEGMTVAGLRRALEEGVRVVISTPRAHNPTGVSTSAARAEALREELRSYPHVLVVEDDHFSMLASTAYHSIVPDGHRAWVLIRSLSKFLGPDLRVALIASDRGTAERLSVQISAGANWVSHILQRTARVLLEDPKLSYRSAQARDHYRRENARFLELLAEQNVSATADDGLNVWVNLGVDENGVARELLRAGWVVRVGNHFALTPESGAGHVRLTVHGIDDDEKKRLAEAMAEAIKAVS